MLGKMKINSDIENGWACEEEILKVLGLKEGDNEGVKIRLYHHNITSFRSSFGGIRLEVVDATYHSVYRRVPVHFDIDQKVYTIDLDQIMEKYEELKKLNIEFEKQRKINDKTKKETLKIISELKDKLLNVDICKLGDSFNIKINNLNEEMVKTIVEILKHDKRTEKA